jgi:hypothetical protein
MPDFTITLAVGFVIGFIPGGTRGFLRKGSGAIHPIIR